MGLIKLQFLACCALGPQVLAQATRVIGNQRVGGFQYIGGRTVVLFQAVQGGRREILLETLHVFHARPAKTVNGLIVIADREQVVLLARQQAQPGILQLVGVLELIHQQVAETLPVMLQQVVLVAQQFMGAQQQFGKIDQPGTVAGLLVIVVNRCHLLPEGVAVGIDMLRAQTFILARVDEPLRLLGSMPVFIQVHAADDLSQGAQLVFTVEYLETVRQARFLPVQAQEPVGQPVKSAHPHAVDGALKQGLDAGAHLRRGLVGKGHGQYAEGPGLFHLQVPGDTMRQHPGLAAAGAGQHQDIAGRRADGLALRLVQTV